MNFACIIFALLPVIIQTHLIHTIREDPNLDFNEAIENLESLASSLVEEDADPIRLKRNVEDKGVTNLDIRDAILKLLNVVKDGQKDVEKHEIRGRELSEQILERMKNSGTGAGTAKKIDNISTFLLRMNAKLDSIERKVRRSSSSSGDILETLAQESYDILTLLPTYIENTKDAISVLSVDTKKRFQNVEKLLGDDESNANGNGKPSLAQVVKKVEANLMGASEELRDIVVESGHMAESLFERVNDGYKDLTDEIKGLSNVEQVLLETADGVMDTKRKVEFGVQQIIYKVGELVKLSGGEIDEQLKDQFADITKTILSNQTEALGNLTRKVEKEIGQVWRQMGIMYGQVSNSISILEKVKESTEGYVNNTGKNLGTMEGQVEGLTDRMVDVDSNLNYMLGQLSLVVQEFNQVKTGLGEAMTGLGQELDEIKEYKPAQARINNDKDN